MEGVEQKGSFRFWDQIESTSESECSASDEVLVVPYDNLAPMSCDITESKQLLDKLVVVKYNGALGKNMGFGGPESSFNNLFDCGNHLQPSSCRVSTLEAKAHWISVTSINKPISGENGLQAQVLEDTIQQDVPSPAKKFKLALVEKLGQIVKPKYL
ncbi:hypothetical protein GOBAR_DD34203 [Gossypium barbadense]|nr:hypothetical protein GOBAR_DD34203 [Gossypium barbadense]